MENIDDYVRERFGKLSKEKVEKIRRTMQKYGDNHWWESTDPAELAAYQIFEPILLVPFGTFHEGIEKLLGREIHIHELSLNLEGVQKEAMLGIARLKMGLLELTDKEKAEKMGQSIKMLEDYCQKNNKILINLPQDLN